MRAASFEGLLVNFEETEIERRGSVMSTLRREGQIQRGRKIRGGDKC